MARERGSSAPAWAPSALSPSAVYDAADPNIVLVGSDIDQVPDLYGSGTTIIAPAASNRPLLVAGALNGQPVMRHASGGNDYLRATSFSWGGTVGGMTAWFVAVTSTTGLVRYLFDYLATDRILFYAGTTQIPTLQITGTGGASVAAGSDTTATARLWTAWWNGSRLRIYSGSTQVADVASTHAAFADSGSMNVGSSNTGGTPWVGDIAQCGFVRRAITVGAGSELESLHAYAQSRWGVP
jgi:hypothetical protein